MLAATLIDLDVSYYNSSPADFVDLNGVLIFAAETVADPLTGATDKEMWRSDGTEAGTYRVRDINPGAASAPSELVRVGNFVYFIAQSESGIGLWKTDGTSAGTTSLRTFSSGTPTQLTVLGDRLFFVANDSAGFELWMSDGAAAGTARYADVRPGANSSSPQQLTIAGDYLYFAAWDANSTHILLAN